MDVNRQTRRTFLKTIGYAAASTAMISTGCSEVSQIGSEQKKRPNIIVILTDDQGFGDVGFHGNKTIKTPNLDSFARDNVEFTQFYVCPVCSPTRASVLTGRYHYRTGVTNVGSAGDRINVQEETIAETLRQAGYATAIYGKWHIGDNYPMRPQDKGFEEAIVHKACCLTPWFRPGGDNYFDPLLYHNGKLEKYKGYCMNVYTDLTIEFARENKDKPFFVYLSTNTPHGPLAITEEYIAPYRAMGLSDGKSRAYGTITNIDDNFGRLIGKLKEMGIDGNTIIVFLSDNGPASSDEERRGGLRGQKSLVYEGGIRVPCLFSWPGNFKGRRKIDRIAAHIDLVPTLLEAAGVKPPRNVKIDGKSLMPLLYNEDVNWPDRNLFIQWHQGVEPEIYRAFIVRNQKYKLVQAQGNGSGILPAEKRKYELFDIPNDPFEKNDIAAKHPDIVEKMKREYKDWFKDVMKTRGDGPQRVYIGTPHENPVTLLNNASLVNQKIRPIEVLGRWPVDVKRKGRYEVTIHFGKALKSAGTVSLKLGDVDVKKDVDKGTLKSTIKNVWLKKGPGDLEANIRIDGEKIIPNFVEVKLSYPGLPI